MSNIRTTLLANLLALLMSGSSLAIHPARQTDTIDDLLSGVVAQRKQGMHERAKQSLDTASQLLRELEDLGGVVKPTIRRHRLFELHLRMLLAMDAGRLEEAG